MFMGQGGNPHGVGMNWGDTPPCGTIYRFI
jgi:hypothetical protein